MTGTPSRHADIRVYRRAGAEPPVEGASLKIPGADREVNAESRRERVSSRLSREIVQFSGRLIGLCTAQADHPPLTPPSVPSPPVRHTRQPVGAGNCVPYATWEYSWIRPPSRSRRRTRTFAPDAGGRGRPEGGLCCSARCARCEL